ncbi:MAG TPA: PEGA domain-containing protein, partial [Kofleriaceae bacterium]|nr:PEGA domain-containing protein [Kofleriaceae bacterium]
ADRPRSRTGGALRALLLVLVLAAMGGAGYFGYMELVAGRSGGGVAAASEGDREAPASSPAAPGSEEPSPSAAATTAAGDAGAPDTAAAASAEQDAGADQAAGEAAGDLAADPADRLVIKSTPRGAKVYLDGALVGRTPVEQESTGDRHRLAIVHPGYKLHVADIQGRGTIAVTLEEVTPPNGPAGIKVRCRKKNRYYVTVDSIEVGQLCPTERIGVQLGEHTVEIYDPVTDERRVFQINVDQTRLSHRVRVD